MNISPCEHKSGQMLRAVRQSLTWMPETFMRGFQFRSILCRERCAHICLAPSQNSKCLAAKHSCLNPLCTNFLVTCPRLDLNEGITARGCAWMSPEETVVVFVQCFYTDVAQTSISNFRRVGTAFAGKLPQTRTVLLFGSYSGRQIFPRRNLLTLVGESNTKFERYIACCVERQWNELPAKLKIT